MTNVLQVRQDVRRPGDTSSYEAAQRNYLVSGLNAKAETPLLLGKMYS